MVGNGLQALNYRQDMRLDLKVILSHLGRSEIFKIRNNFFGIKKEHTFRGL